MKLEWDLMNNIKHVFVTLAQKRKKSETAKMKKNEHLVVNLHVIKSHEHPVIINDNFLYWTQMNCARFARDAILVIYDHVFDWHFWSYLNLFNYVL